MIKPISKYFTNFKFKTELFCGQINVLLFRDKFKKIKTLKSQTRQLKFEIRKKIEMGLKICFCIISS